MLKKCKFSYKLLPDVELLLFLQRFPANYFD